MSMNLSEIRLYSPRGLFYTGHVSEPLQEGDFTKAERAIGKHLHTPEFIPVNVKNDGGQVFGTVRDLGNEELPYRVRLWVMVEYEPEKL